MFLSNNDPNQKFDRSHIETIQWTLTVDEIQSCDYLYLCKIVSSMVHYCCLVIQMELEMEREMVMVVVVVDP